MQDEKQARLEALQELLSDEVVAEESVAEEATDETVAEEEVAEEAVEGEVEAVAEESEEEVSEESTDDHNEMLKGMFKDSELSEEAQEKIAVLFEAAVNYTVDKKVDEIKTKLDEEFEAAVEANRAELQEEADTYLSYVVNEWADKNEVAIQAKAKMDIFESFVSGMRELFLEHDIDVPEASVSLVDELMEKVESLEEDVKTLAKQNSEVSEELDHAQRAIALSEAAKGMTELEAEKLKGLVESKEFSTLEDYKKGVALIKESFFEDTADVVAEEEIIAEEKSVEIPDSIKAYAEALSRSVRK